MGRLASEVLVERLAAWGVDTVFGLPGDGINGIMEGLRRHQDAIRMVLVQHEEAAAFMATGYAKATGRLGVCLATSGPGGIHLLNGLYDAKLDHAPVLAITGSQETSLLGSGYQQEVHLEHVYADVAEFNLLVTNPQQLPQVVDTAIRTAYARRGVAHLCVPNDIQIADADADPYEHPAPAQPTPTAPVYFRPPGRPRDADLQTAADALNAGERVAILVGAGALGAREQVEQVADTLAAPVVKSLLGKGVLADDSPYTTGGLGLLGTAPSEDVMGDADTLLMLGTSFPYSTYLPDPSAVTTVQIEADPSRAGMRMPTVAPVVGDVGEALTALLPLLARKDDRSHLEKHQRAMGQWRQRMAALEDAERSPIAPQYPVAVLDELCSDDAILVCDSGTVTTWAARHWDIRGGREFYVSGNLASMACGLPYAIAMQHAHPGRQVVAYVGDGGFAMLMAEFLTAVRHGLPITVVVNNNNAYGQILWEQVVLGYPEHMVRQERPVADFAAWATSCGGYGAKVTEPGDVRAAVSAALAHDGPALVDVDVDPNEPPMPGHVKFEQVRKFAASFLRGQPHRVETATSVIQDEVQQLRE